MVYTKVKGASHRLLMSVLFAILLGCFASKLHAGNFLLDFQMGSGDIKIDAGKGLSIRTTGFDTVGGSVYGGYRFDNNIFTRIGVGYQRSEDIFGIADSAKLTTYEALIGYSFNLENFFIRPQVGAAHWRLKLKEGIFLNPGDEERVEDSGEDYILLLDLGYAFTDRLGMRLSYKTIDSEIGRYSSSTVGLNLRFR
jgi:hypothetical protein